MSGEQEGVRERAADEIAGVSIGSGYYETSVGHHEARECARLALASLDHPETVAGLAEVLGAHDADRTTYDAYCVDGCQGCDWRPAPDPETQAHHQHIRHLSEVALRWLAGRVS